MARCRARTAQPITPGLALLPVRLFLGVTFVYAGYQKLSDPGFLHPGSATYIGTQLHAFANGTPGGFLLRWFAIPQPRVAGVGVALAEIAIGLLTTAGMLTRAAAAAGLGAEPGAVPDRELDDHPLLPRPGHRLLLRLAAAGAGRSGRPARGRHAPPRPPDRGSRPAGRAAARTCMPRPTWIRRRAAHS